LFCGALLILLKIKGLFEILVKPPCGRNFAKWLIFWLTSEPPVAGGSWLIQMSGLSVWRRVGGVAVRAVTAGPSPGLGMTNSWEGGHLWSPTPWIVAEAPEARRRFVLSQVSKSRPGAPRMVVEPAGAGRGSWVPTLAAKTKTRRGWGTHGLWLRHRRLAGVRAFPGLKIETWGTHGSVAGSGWPVRLVCLRDFRLRVRWRGWRLPARGGCRGSP
jgi:hypothetical protein